MDNHCILLFHLEEQKHMIEAYKIKAYHIIQKALSSSDGNYGSLKGATSYYFYITFVLFSCRGLGSLALSAK